MYSSDIDEIEYQIRKSKAQFANNLTKLWNLSDLDGESSEFTEKAFDHLFDLVQQFSKLKAYGSVIRVCEE